MIFTPAALLLLNIEKAKASGVCQPYSSVRHKPVYKEYDKEDIRIITSFFQFIPIQAVQLQPVNVGVGVGTNGQSQQNGVQYNSTQEVDGPPEIVQENSNAPSQTNAKDFSLMKSTCASCHQEGIKQSGGVRLFDRAGNYAPNRSWDKIASQISSGSMPPSKTLPLDTKKSLLQLLLK